MFYSHQLLARKAPLGQIWMAATMHQKLNRRKLDKLDIIQICEEILNPSVPMALRLSGILMGGVVIVYERKVKLLYDDATRLLVEINQAWKVKAVPDPTVLPKGKSHAKYEAVTLPENKDVLLGETEQTLQFTESATLMGFHQTSYIAMRLDDVDEPLLGNNPRDEEDPFHHYHRADAANITLSDRFDTYHQEDTDVFNRFERFDIEGDEETHPNLSNPQEHTDIPTTLIPSPPVIIQQEDEPPERKQSPVVADEIHEQHPQEEEDRLNQHSADEAKEANQPQQDEWRQRRAPQRKRARRPTQVSIMDYEQTVIPGQMYQSWLQDASNLLRVRKRKHIGSIQRTKKMPDLMELPSLVLIDGLFDSGTGEVHFPAPLLELFRTRNVQHPLISPAAIGRASPPQPSSSSSPPERTHYQDQRVEFPFEEVHDGVGTSATEFSIEKQRTNVVNNVHDGVGTSATEFSIEKQRTTVVNNNKMSAETLMEELKTNFMNNNGETVTDTNVIVTPGNSGNEVRSIPGSGSGKGFALNNSEVNSGRSKKRQSSSHGGSGLEPVAEENSWPDSMEPNFKLPRLSENGLQPKNDMLVETEPTQTQNHPTFNQSTDHITESIRKQLKIHFDTPESEKVSLNQMASGMSRKSAACLFYQTCVLATRGYTRVHQKEPYGDILISRGAKM